MLKVLPKPANFVLNCCIVSGFASLSIRIRGLPSLKIPYPLVEKNHGDSVLSPSPSLFSLTRCFLPLTLFLFYRSSFSALWPLVRPLSSPFHVHFPFETLYMYRIVMSKHEESW
ncbi:unnamed protein product [Lactuca saligna]|uniref:Uncharacterized protein n=1 Tax=Lactuca saligna TaxID=75948 RepID=A0AA35VMW5_LACSI|nr:unnamed protein product [Lactuca saligna]